MEARAAEVSSRLQVYALPAIVWRENSNKNAEFEGDDEEERSGTTDQQARKQDAERKKRMAETADKRAAESCSRRRQGAAADAETKQAVCDI